MSLPDIPRRRLLAAAALGAAAAFAPVIAPAADGAWPTRPVTLVLPFPPAGATDLMARVLGQRLTEMWGQPVVIENRPGGGTLIGSEYVARAKPDGYTLLLNVNALVQAPHLRSSVSFDPVRELTPITEAAGTALIMVVHPNVPAANAEELVKEVRANPGKYSYGSYGAGSSAHLYGHVFNQQNGLDMVHVAYKGEAPSVQDLLGGQIPIVIMSGVNAVPNIQAGKMRAIAVTGPVRADILPDVPTFQELGYTGMGESGWFGFFAPAGTPEAIVQKISRDINVLLQEPEVIERLAPAGLVLKGSTPEAFAKVVAADAEKWGRLIREAGIRVD